MLLEKFQSQCARAPDRPAVVADTRRLSYGDLDKRSAALARFVVHQGLGSGSTVALFLPRSVDLLVGLVGVMRAGAAYTVIEDDGPTAECHHRVHTIAPDFVLCEAQHVAELQALGLRAATVHEALQSSHSISLPRVSPSDIAYVLFTSGSTGKPKGVAVTHANLAHYTGSIAEQLAVKEPLRYAHASTLAADLGNTSLFLSLWSGGCLYLIDARMRRDPAALRDHLIEHRIQFVKITPSHWNAIFSSMGEKHLKALCLQVLVLGGEVLPASLARRILASGAVRVLLNHYGPTETTVGVTTFPISDLGQLATIEGDSVPIGLPLGRTELRVRTEAGLFYEKSARGELYIGGPSVGQGYVNDPSATAASFVVLNEPNAQGRFYKTGDQVTIDDNGVVKFLGRVDRQVKVNGYRVELEHVESLLRAGPGVTDAAAFFLEVRGKPRIVAALAGAQDPGFEQLKQHLERVMPAYMLPKIFLRIEGFPRNENGKSDLKALRARVEHMIEAQTAARAPATAVPQAGDDMLVAEIRKSWAIYLRDDTFGNDDNFFDLGGDSLDAIQLIAELQLQGHEITTHAFLEQPTVHGLAQVIRQRESAAAAKPLATPSEESRSLSAAQDFFFRQRLANPDHYNQSLLLECSAKIDAKLLRKVLAQLVRGHASLRCAYHREDDTIEVRTVNAPAEALLDLSFTLTHDDERRVETHIERTAQRVQESLSLERGVLFKAHLFKFEAAPDQLLLVAHHVAVDVISWRVLISELARLYIQQAGGTEMELPVRRHSFWDWVRHLDTHRDTLYRNAEPWLAETVGRVRRQPTPYDERNVEGSAQTLWLDFSAYETRRLQREAPTLLKAPLHEILLAAFIRALGRQQGQAVLHVDVESHGRVSFDDSLDLSRMVGWHTSTYPLAVPVDADIAGTLASVTRALNNVPNLGAAYGAMEKQRPAGEPARTSSPVCFNYLGEFNFAHDERFTFKPSRYAIGRSRSDFNHRGHELKLTARVVGGHLVVDLSFPSTLEARQVTSMMRGLKHDLLMLVGCEALSTPIIVEPGTRTGQICYVPRELALEPAAVALAGRDYRAVLLTGATGYVGAHVLRELLLQSEARVVCIVRRKGGQSAQQRLEAALGEYFADVPLLLARCTVLAGDVALPCFGLAETIYAQLANTVDAVYHFAADTRLFGPEEEFRRHNVAPVQNCIAFVEQERPKDLHYMSTMAVCGVNPHREAPEFSEDSLDIGQKFQNHYEATKYQAECLLKSFEAAGGRCFIYRSGNVSGHSRTGRFQHNARGNRLVQFLAACVQLGRLPSSLGEPVVLSPIDEVAAGIVAISLDTNSAGGVYHVDSTYEITMQRVFDALRQLGLHFEDTAHPDFHSLFASLRDSRDPVLALGYFWATRKPRNVRFNHERTHQILRRLGRAFSTLDDEWLLRFCSALAEAGMFGARPQQAVAAEAVS